MWNILIFIFFYFHLLMYANIIQKIYIIFNNYCTLYDRVHLRVRQRFCFILLHLQVGMFWSVIATVVKQNAFHDQKQWNFYTYFARILSTLTLRLLSYFKIFYLNKAHSCSLCSVLPSSCSNSQKTGITLQGISITYYGLKVRIGLYKVNVQNVYLLMSV